MALVPRSSGKPDAEIVPAAATSGTRHDGLTLNPSGEGDAKGSIAELLAPSDLFTVLQQGWRPVEEKQLSESPPPRVGATLNCMEVPVHTRGAQRLDERTMQQDTVTEALAAEGPQLGLFLFGGDDEESNQTDTLMVFYLQDNTWRKPAVKGRAPAKRSRHTANVILSGRREKLIVFGGVGATNAVSVLDPVTLEWAHPPARSKKGEKERAARRRATKKKEGDEKTSDSLLPCARFGHSAAVVGQRLYLFGGADFKGPLDDLYELDLAPMEQSEPMEWSRPEPGGLPPPPSAKHCCAVVRDHMLLISGEHSWSGYMWALQLRPQLAWVRSTLPDFPLVGVNRHALVAYLTPRPHRREELLVFGGFLEGVAGVEHEVLDAFFTLDFRSWRPDQAEIPRETWADRARQLAEGGKDEEEIDKARTEWEEERKKKQKELHRAQRRKERLERLRGKRAEAAAEAKGAGGSAAEEEEEELSDEEAIARREHEKEYELPTELMPTITFGDFVPLRVGQSLPPPRFGHTMCLAGERVFVFGGRNRNRTKAVLGDFHVFDAKPLVWKRVSYDGDGPGSRISHAMVLQEHYLYVLGGGSGNRSFNDLHRLDLFTMHWEIMHTRGHGPQDKPDALIGHSVQWVDPYVVVFAGGNGKRPSNDLHTLELETGLWRKIETSGAPPAPRVGHSSTQIGADMFIIGGFSKGKYYHDVHSLNVESLLWSQQVTSGTPPHGRVSHSATLHNGKVHLFGGSAGGTCFNDYAVFTPTLTDAHGNAAEAKGILKGGRKAAADRAPRSVGRSGTWSTPAVSGFPPEARYSHSATLIGSMLFIVGGLGKKGRPKDDLHVLDLASLTWSLPRVTLEGPAPRGRHTVAALGSVLFLFGGGAQGDVYDDIWALDIDGKGMGKLAQLATSAVAQQEARKAAEQVIPMSFLAPHMGAAPPSDAVADREYEDHAAKAADADEVRSWLMHLGLAQHAYTFEAHEIDFEVLLELQEADLADMGVDDPMQRLRLLNGIEVLRQRGALSAAGRAPRERLFRERYRMGAEINFGGQPAVLAVDVKTDLKVAVKFVGDMAEYHRQDRLHKDLKGECVARVADKYAAYRPGQPLPGGLDGDLHRGWGLPSIVLEYGEFSLADYMGRGVLSPVEIKATFEGLLKCVLALHAKGVAHCALQPESFRLYEGTHWRIATMDSVTPFGQPAPEKVAVCYAAPEVARHLRRPTRGGGTSGGGGAAAAAARAGQSIATAPADAAMDVWSLGVLLWQMFSQEPLVGTEAEALAMLPSVGAIEPSMGCVTDLQARHLLEKMLCREPSERISAQKILKHGYLTGGLDTVQMETTFGPMQKGQLFLRSLLQQLGQGGWME